MSKSTNRTTGGSTRAAEGPPRATAEGTRRFAERRAAAFEPNFYRATPLDLCISSVGIGTYLGDASEADDSAYEMAVSAAVDAGINFIDTAINYRSQRSEIAIGKALQSLLARGTAARDGLVVCTKAGYIPFDGTPPATREEYQAYVQRAFIEPRILDSTDIVAGGHSIAPRFLRYCIAKSRQNLGLRSIDVFYLHNPEQQLSAITTTVLAQRLRAAFEVLEEAVGRGDIGAYGVATWDGLRVGPDHPSHLDLQAVVDAARSVAGDAHHLRAVQLPINLAMPEAVSAATQTANGRSTAAVDAARELGLSVIASASLLQGRLTRGLPGEIATQFPALGTDAQRSLAFVRGIHGVDSALVGMRSTDHVAENLGAARP